jgi:hypothetical protein
MKIRRLIYYSIFILVSIHGANSQDVKVSAAFDTTWIYIGDQIHYTVTVEQPSGTLLQIQSHKDTLCKNVEILSGPETDSSAIGDDRLRIIRKYLVTSFDTGIYQVPPVFAEINYENGIRRFYSDYALLEVIRVKITPPDTAAKIFDIIQPYRAPVTLGEIIPWVLLATMVAVLVWLIIKFLPRFRKASRHEEAVINPDPAHIIAFRDLERLKNEQLWQKGEVKNYYSRLTEIIRQYLENRFGVYSLEMTTSETLEELVRTGFKKDDSYVMLKTILNGSDLVKFAKYKPESSENELHFDNSWRFVDITKIQPESAEKVDANNEKESVS